MLSLTATSTSAAGGVTFTVAVASAYLHAEPINTSERTYSVFKGRTYNITGRTADNAWVSLDYATATAGTWIRAGMGTIAGSLDSVAVRDGTFPTLLPAEQPPVTTSAEAMVRVR